MAINTKVIGKGGDISFVGLCKNGHEIGFVNIIENDGKYTVGNFNDFFNDDFLGLKTNVAYCKKCQYPDKSELTTRGCKTDHWGSIIEPKEPHHLFLEGQILDIYCKEEDIKRLKKHGVYWFLANNTDSLESFRLKEINKANDRIFNKILSSKRNPQDFVYLHLTSKII